MLSLSGLMEKLAQALCSGEWDIYKPVAIEMEEFLDDWLPGMHSDLLMVGVTGTRISRAITGSRWIYLRASAELD